MSTEVIEIKDLAPPYKVRYTTDDSKNVYNWLLANNSAIDAPDLIVETNGYAVTASNFITDFEKTIREEMAGVNHPAHYNQYEGLEIIDLCEQMNFNRGNVVKYVARAGFKDPETELQDLMKAKFYIDREIHRLEKKGN